MAMHAYGERRGVCYGLDLGIELDDRYKTGDVVSMQCLLASANDGLYLPVKPLAPALRCYVWYKMPQCRQVP